MEILLEELIRILGREIEQHTMARDVAAREQRVIVEVRLDDLGGIIEEQEGLLLRMRELERERFRKVLEIAKALQIPYRGVTVSLICKVLTGGLAPYAERLREHARTLRSLMDEIAALNEDNNRLIKSSMSFLDGTLREVFSSGKNPTVYSQKGKLFNGEEERKHVLFVNRKV